MKKSHLPLLALIILIFGACSSPKQSTGVWVNKEKIQGKTFKKLFIVVMTADIEARSVVENDLAKVATKRGLEVVKSIDVMSPNLSDPLAPAKDEIVKQVKATGCDAVLIAALLKQDEDAHYTPGGTAYTVMPTVAWSGTYVGYYSYYQPTVYTPSYYSKEKSYFMQSNLYDAASQEIMWSVQSEIFNPSSLDKFSRSYTQTLIKQLQDDGLAKK
jgi:hypothetical protein